MTNDGAANETVALTRHLLIYSNQIPPRVSLAGKGEDARLEWGWGGSKQRHRKDAKLLDSFIQLEGAPPKDILAFARRNGVLMYCPDHWMVDCDTFRCPWRGADPLWVWYGAIKKVRALVRIAKALHREEQGPAQDWLDAYRDVGLQFTEGTTPRPEKAGILWEKENVAYEVDDLLHLAAVTAKFRWDGQGPQITLSGKGLLGPLSIELANTVARTSGLVLCSSCGAPYLPTRKPADGRRNYCEQCRAEGRDRRDADRAYAWRKRQAVSN